MNIRPGIDSTVLLIARRWKQEDCCDSTSFVNQQFAVELQKSGFDVLSTVLEATDDEKHDAKTKNITLILPEHKPRKSYKIKKKDWLMYPDKYYKALEGYEHVSFIAGHVNEKGYDTVEEAFTVRDRYFKDATVVIFLHHIPDMKGFGCEDVIGERDILQFAEDSELVLVVGHNLNSHYLTRLADSRDRIITYLPAPEERYLASNVKPLPVNANIEILSVEDFSNKKTLQYCNPIAQAMGKVTSNFATMFPTCPIWNLCHKKKKDVGKFDGNLFNGCTNLENLQTFEEYYDGDMNNLLTIFMQSSLLIDTSTDVFSLTGLNAIAAGLPVLFNENSSIANFLKSDCFLESYTREILVKLAVNESFDEAAGKWAKIVTKCVKDREIRFRHASKLKEDLLKSIKEGSIEKSHQEIITWFQMKVAGSN